CVCAPLTCVDLGAQCGSPPDGCGGFVDCGMCLGELTCGGGGVPYVCGTTCSGCCPLTCGQRGIECGPAGDGRGGLVRCGDCVAPDTCGGGGLPGHCGHDCMPQTCQELGLNVPDQPILPFIEGDGTGAR